MRVRESDGESSRTLAGSSGRVGVATHLRHSSYSKTHREKSGGREGSAHLLSKRSCAPDCTGSSLHEVVRRAAAAHER